MSGLKNPGKAGHLHPVTCFDEAAGYAWAVAKDMMKAESLFIAICSDLFFFGGVLS